MASPQKKDYIDAVRGWAIALVITSHVGVMFAELPYPIKKLTNFGVYGVQMFFLASAVTLLMSWHRRKEEGAAAVKIFFIRRFLRIAPMYYLGSILYYYIEPPETGFDAVQMLRSFVFINVWHPEWVPTTPGWTVVPGGWSIGVEFTFYFLFPVLAAMVTTLPRAIALFFASIVLAATANGIGAVWLSAYAPEAADRFLYFWFFNQAPVFSLGFILYFLLTRPGFQIRSTALAYWLVASIGATWLILAEYPSATHWFGWTTGVPTFLFATLSFMAFILLLARGPETLFTHTYVRRLGVLSFSSYVLHFLFARKIAVWSFGLINLQATGFAAIGNCAALWVLTMTLTVLASAVAHALIEQPAIDWAHRLTSPRRYVVAPIG